MSDNIDGKFIGEMLRGIQTSITEQSRRIDAVEHRMAGLERFQSAVLHSQQGIIAHLAGIHESIDDMRSQYRRLDQRMDAVEAR